MTLEVIEEVGNTRVGRWSWQHPDGGTGENRLYASTDGATWREIDSYVVTKNLLGPESISIVS